jgi:short-subunit dehydrogenase
MLDILVNNSGSGYAMPVLDSDMAVSKALFDVNFFAVISVTQAFIPLLVKSKGTVVNNTSFVSVLPVPFQGVYNASKAAASMLASTMRIELAPLGVKVVDLRTGL